MLLNGDSSTQQLLFLSITTIFISFATSFQSRVGKFTKVNWENNEEDDQVYHSDRECWTEQSSNLVLERNTEQVEEQEVGWVTHQEEKCASPCVGVMLESQNHIGNENAYTIDCHTSNPETDVLTIWLLGRFLCQAPEAAVEYECSVH